MSMTVSRNKIITYQGNVVSLKIENVPADRIVWTCGNEDIVFIRRFASVPEGVLLVMKAAGSTNVTVSCGDETVYVPVTVCPPHDSFNEENVRFFIGDLHDHTSNNHKIDEFRARTEGLPSDSIGCVKSEGLLDFFVVTDHAGLMDDHDFFRSFVSAEELSDEGLVVFGGAESQVNLYEKDFYGLSHKNAGEVITLNADNYVDAPDWEIFFSRMKENEDAVFSFAHPQVVGWDENGIWCFDPENKGTDLMKKRFCLTEMGTGDDNGGSNMIHEWMYSLFLDCGFHVSPVSCSDCHGPAWGFDAWGGKTVIVASEKNKEAFLRAMRARRTYATESGVRLWYTVNGKPGCGHIEAEDRYVFDVRIGTLDGFGKADVHVLQVISDGGLCVYEENVQGKDAVSFALDTPESCWFYLRLVDAHGCRTWSQPVLVNGKTPKKTALPVPERLDKHRFDARLADGGDATVLINGDPTKPLVFDGTSGCVTVDMGELYEISGVGIYPFRFTIADCHYGKDFGIQKCCASMAKNYEIAVSVNGKDFRRVYTGSVRAYGKQEIAFFDEKMRARYVRFDFLNTIGSAQSDERFAAMPLCVGELDIFA